MKINKKLLVFFLILVVAILAFIYWNSFQNSESSNQLSSSVLDLILKKLDPEGKLHATKVEKIHYIVRKLAHFTEFFALGLAECALMIVIFGERKAIYISLTLLLVLFAAVIDEFIQSFTARTSSVLDVLIDFAGAFLGVCTSLIVYRIILAVRRKKQKRKLSKEERI